MSSRVVSADSQANAGGLERVTQELYTGSLKSSLDAFQSARS